MPGATEALRTASEGFTVASVLTAAGAPPAAAAGAAEAGAAEDAFTGAEGCSMALPASALGSVFSPNEEY